MARLLSDKTAKSFERAAKHCFASVPAKYTKTLTLDNGVETSNYEEIERGTQLQVYFAHLTQEMLDAAVKRLNTRPRKRLDYKSPEQMFKAKW